MFVKGMSKREKTILSATAVVLAMASAYVLVIEPALSGSISLDRKIAVKSAELERDRAILARYSAAGKTDKGYPPDGKNMSEEEHTAGVISAVESLSRENSCPITSLKPRMPKKMGGYRDISIEVTVEGGMDGLSKFIYGVETSKERLKIRQFNISSRSSSSEGLRAVVLISKLIPA